MLSASQFERKTSKAYLISYKVWSRCTKYQWNHKCHRYITKFTGDTNEDSVVSGPVCQSNANRSGIGEEELYWQFEGRQIPIAISGEGDHSGFKKDKFSTAKIS